MFGLSLTKAYRRTLRTQTGSSHQRPQSDGGRVGVLSVSVRQRVSLCGGSLLVRAADPLAWTQRDVRLVHGLDVGFGCHDDALRNVSAAHPPPAIRKNYNKTGKVRTSETGIMYLR